MMADEFKDYVRCNNCDWIGFVYCDEDKCPECGYEGGLMDLKQAGEQS